MQNQSILIVDDESEMRIAMSQTLNRVGYLVDTASNGYEAIEKVKKGIFRAVVTDVKMPEISGLDVLKEIKKISPHIPVIMITAYGTINSAVKAMKEGASDYIVKPFSANILENAVKKAFESTNKDKNNYETLIVNNNISENKIIITKDEKFLNIISLAKSVASSNATVLILGESGTGKELLASYIHKNCDKRNGKYVAVNCAALPENLIESELFGHEKGSFTGATFKKIGKFEAANNGTIVLDEISEMPFSLQAKLLRVIQEKEICRIGGNKNISIDVRIIAISNIDISTAVKEGKFREDLFYRINVVPLKIPPLRERKKDILYLADYFLKSYCMSNHKKIMDIDSEAKSILYNYNWPGNVRELENIIERAVILNKDGLIKKEDLFLEINESKKKKITVNPGMSVKEMEEELIYQTLKEVNGNRTHAADMLGISIRTLRNKLKEYNAVT